MPNTALPASDVATRTTQLAGSSPQERVQARNDLLAAEARVNKLAADLTLLKEGPRRETVKAAEADVLAAKADVAAAEARLTQSRWRLDNCVIKAPVSGTVLEVARHTAGAVVIKPEGGYFDAKDFTRAVVELKNLGAAVDAAAAAQASSVRGVLHPGPARGAGPGAATRRTPGDPAARTCRAAASWADARGRSVR